MSGRIRHKQHEGGTERGDMKTFEVIFRIYIVWHAGEEAMERNNWASQNSQRVVELKEEEEDIMWQKAKK